MFDDILWEKRERHFHILVPVQRHFEIHVFDVGSCKTGAFGANRAVSKEFGGDHVGGMRCEFKRVINQVAANCGADIIRVRFLGAMVNDDASIGDRAVDWDVSDFSVGKEENSVSGLRDTYFALGESI